MKWKWGVMPSQPLTGNALIEHYEKHILFEAEKVQGISENLCLQTIQSWANGWKQLGMVVGQVKPVVLSFEGKPTLATEPICGGREPASFLLPTPQGTGVFWPRNPGLSLADHPKTRPSKTWSLFSTFFLFFFFHCKPSYKNFEERLYINSHVGTCHLASSRNQWR